MCKSMVVDGTELETMDLHLFSQCANCQSGCEGALWRQFSIFLIVTQNLKKQAEYNYKILLIWLCCHLASKQLTSTFIQFLVRRKAHLSTSSYVKIVFKKWDPNFNFIDNTIYVYIIFSSH